MLSRIKALFNSLKEMTFAIFAVEAGYFIPIIFLKILRAYKC